MSAKPKRIVKEAPGTKKARCPNKYAEPGQYVVGKRAEARVDDAGNPYNVDVDVFADRLPDVAS